ncbi:anti-sigma B factor antagonist [Mesobacillus persicus]|uniref:Anti-sigma factor antagonist n=1 Tax=Mesobacillus persicus TaxID=930146 RepID=A0A1H8KBZ3_9BACI|nr:anti-sigma factor antagonist [Mesobacillus persicus]SEN90267.1 anti-sigma B factor antagonist [Mesobacillus persicus]
MNLSIDVNETDILLEITVNGEIDAYTAPKLRDTIFPLSEKNGVNMVINLSGVSYMDSTGLGVFVGVFKNVKANGGQFKINGLSGRLERLFEITGLADIIDVNSQIEGEVK